MVVSKQMERRIADIGRRCAFGEVLSGVER